MDRWTQILVLEQRSDHSFRGQAFASNSSRIFGGQVAAQALVAAGSTTPADRVVHSLHSYFLRPGDPGAPVDYEVGIVRDGGSFTTRSVTAVQRGEAIFSLSASFTSPRPPSFEHQVLAPAVVGPEDLPSGDVPVSTADPRTQEWWAEMKVRHPFEIRFVSEPARAAVARGELPGPREHVWLRSCDPLPDDPLMHACAATLSSDLLLLGSALPPHGATHGDDDLVSLSLDHALWFHRSFRADDWYLYDMEGWWTGAGRALCRGRMFDQAGRLLATVIQEGLLSYRK
jgi:acyl-CoA thioesterase-2